MPILKPYNIAINATENSAEINMYGEVVSTRPTDWWTGEPIPGDFIAQDEFLRDLEELSAVDSITVHINSVGGDMYAGIAIYNRLKGLAAKVTTINDGLAASAGSLIFMAGDTRKVNAGSNLMIHGAAGFLYGYYQVQDLKSAVKQLDAHNKAGVNIYAEATGKDKESIKAMVDRETWLTGQEAVDAGFADEVIGEESNPVQMRLSPDRSTMMVNGYKVAARFLGNIPENIPQMSAEEWSAVANAATTNMQPAPQADINTIQDGGKNMEFKTPEELRAAHPDLVAQIETAARAEGATAERNRIQGIEEIQNAIGDTVMIQNAKYGETPMNAEQLAFAAMKAQAAIGNQMLGKMATDTASSGVANVTTAPAATDEPKNEDEQAIELLVKAIPNNLKKEDK